VEVNPRYADGWAQLGIALKRQRKFEEAQQAFAKAYELDPSHPIARLERG
jgi:cytochrome c-type biogenesis protein CcmH/NrfG